MKNISLIIFVALTLAGCINEENVPKTDQCMRREIFAQCMKMLPKGPVATHYNDWDDVVKECDSIAYYQSRRALKFIKEECRSI